MKYEVPIYKLKLVRSGTLEVPGERPQVVGPSVAAEIAMAYLDSPDREHFLVIMLDSAARLIGINPVAMGSLTAVLVEPREVFKPAIEHNTAMLIAIHNHPSGDVAHTEEDIELINRLVYCGEMLGIPLFDHIIVNDLGEYASAVETGIMI